MKDFFDSLILVGSQSLHTNFIYDVLFKGKVVLLKRDKGTNLSIFKRKRQTVGAAQVNVAKKSG